MLQLTRPIIVFDLETTGPDISKDRIVEIGMVKLFPEGHTEKRRHLVNPQRPIPHEVSLIHGITDEMVKNEPPFPHFALDLLNFLLDCDLAGFNAAHFDLPMLVEEFLRAGIDPQLEKARMVDVQRIYHQMEPRNLGAAYKFYCDKTLEDAHSAMADTEATLEVLQAQLQRYPALKTDVNSLADMTGKSNRIDFAGRFVLGKSGKAEFNFGKHKGKLVTDVLKAEPGYFSWMMQGDFALDTKRKLKQMQESNLVV